MDEKKRIEIIEKFSNILRERGITKSQLIDITGLNKNTITNLFAVNYYYATLPDFKTVYKILSALSSLGVYVNINDILGLPDPKDIEIEKFNINIKELIECTNKIIIRQGGNPISYVSDTNSHNMKLFQYSFNCTSNISVYKYLNCNGSFWKLWNEYYRERYKFGDVGILSANKYISLCYMLGYFEEAKSE